MAREIPLYEIPKKIETARVLDDSKLEQYIEHVKSTYNTERARNTLLKFDKSNSELTNSNPFMIVCLQNSGILPPNERIATRENLEVAIKNGKDYLGIDNIFSGNYSDFGVGLFTGKDSHAPNDLLVKILMQELKSRTIKLGKGKLIQTHSLELKEDKDSAYGLVFNLKDSVNSLDDLNKFKWDYTRDEGIARACLDRDGYWGCGGQGLAGSSGSGRVVVVSGEATRKNFMDFMNKYNLVKQAEFNLRIKNAQNIINNAFEQAKFSFK